MNTMSVYNFTYIKHFRIHKIHLLLIYTYNNVIFNNNRMVIHDFIPMRTFFNFNKSFNFAFNNFASYFKYLQLFQLNIIRFYFLLSLTLLLLIYTFNILF